MFNRKICLSLRNNSHIYIIAISCFSLILTPCQGCSTQEQTREVSTQPTVSKVQGKLIGAPKLKIEKTSYDFGDIRPSSKNTATFLFSNTGNELLKITNIKKCCGAVIKLDKEELAPGESGVLTAQYQAGQGAGILNKNIGFSTNDPDNPQTILTITGKVVPTLKWSPGRFEIAPYNQDASCPEITITSLDDTSFAIKEFNSTNQCFSIENDPQNKATEFILKPKADLDKLNMLDINRGSISIILDHPDYEVIDLKFTIVPPLQAIPPQILVFNANFNESVLRSLQVKDNRSGPEKEVSELLESIASKNGAKVDVLELSTTQEGCNLNLEIWPSNTGDSDSFSKDELIIKFKDGRELDVPVSFFYKPKTLASSAN